MQFKGPCPPQVLLEHSFAHLRGTWGKDGTVHSPKQLLPAPDGRSADPAMAQPLREEPRGSGQTGSRMPPAWGSGLSLPRRRQPPGTVTLWLPLTHPSQVPAPPCLLLQEKRPDAVPTGQGGRRALRTAGRPERRHEEGRQANSAPSFTKGWARWRPYPLRPPASARTRTLRPGAGATKTAPRKKQDSLREKGRQPSVSTRSANPHVTTTTPTRPTVLEKEREEPKKTPIPRKPGGHRRPPACRVALSYLRDRPAGASSPTGSGAPVPKPAPRTTH